MTEVSAVCTHPDFRGRGYARALVAAVTRNIHGEGRMPFLTSLEGQHGSRPHLSADGFRRSSHFRARGAQASIASHQSMNRGESELHITELSLAWEKLSRQDRQGEHTERVHPSCWINLCSCDSCGSEDFMKAAWYEKQGPAREVLTVGDMLDPAPGPCELRIRIAASGINPGDIKKRQDARVWYARTAMAQGK
jgi:hypothetical protein